MDVVTLGMAKAETAASYAPLGGAAVPLMSRLSAGREAAVLLVLGDSTGDETTVTGRWVYKTAQWLAARFPAYTVNFRQWDQTSGANGAYSAIGVGRSVQMQVGTGTANAGGPFVLDIYNGSASGSSPAYNVVAARWYPMVQVVNPQLVIVNHGHNLSGVNGDNLRYFLYQLTHSLRDTFPRAGLIVTAQNPMKADQGDATLDLVRARAVMDLAATERYGLINILQPFLDAGDYSTLYLADGLHPNEAGSLLWSRKVIQQLQAAIKPTVTPDGAASQRNRMWVPATAFTLFDGTPTLGVVNGEVPMWSFPQAASSSVVTTVDFPEHWVEFDTFLYWTVAGSAGYTSATKISWGFLRQKLAYTSTPSAGVAPFPVLAWVDPGAQTVVPNNGSAYQTFTSIIGQQSQVPNAPYGVRIQRRGTNGTDNIPESAHVLGVMFVRAK